MDRRRIIELGAAALLGGGLVALAYESLGFRSALQAPAPIAADPVRGDDSGARSANGGAWLSPSVAAPGTSADAGGSDLFGAPDETPATAEDPGPGLRRDEDGTYADFPPIYSSTTLTLGADDERAFPKHALVTGLAVIVRERPDIEGPRLGLLRGGARVRADAARTMGGGCKAGWHAIFPMGWVCLDAGIDVGDTPPDDGLVAMAQPDVEQPMPLDYWRVNHDATPFFHRLPSFEEQERADRAGQAWLAARGRTPMPTDPAQRPGEVPAVVKEYLNAGNYVTIESQHVKSQRHFLRTNRGVYAKKFQLEKREGSAYEGQLLGGEFQLPVYFIVRELPLHQKQGEGGMVTATETVLTRRSTHPFKRKVRIGDHDYFEDDEGLLLRAYAVGTASMLARPPGVGPGEHWVHVDLSEQTLVAYDGDRPVFATIVSTGKEPGMTPVGVFRVQSKFIATSMRDQPVEDEAYSIEDVPWTQYFSNNVALHGAFWHGGFGLVRSHGCVNLSPSDARWLFGFLGPHLPPGWHAAWVESATVGQGSPVVITE